MKYVYFEDLGIVVMMMKIVYIVQEKYPSAIASKRSSSSPARSCIKDTRVVVSPETSEPSDFVTNQWGKANFCQHDCQQ